MVTIEFEMNEAKYYQHAPITEAVINLQVDVADGIQINELAALGDLIESEYPEKEMQNRSQAHIEFGPKTSSAVSSEPFGLMFKSLDTKQIIQARLDGFALSRLQPYEGWLPFRDEARRIWEFYRKTTTPKAVTRVAVRYINRIDIPGHKAELTDYFRTAPQISPDLLQPISGYFMRLQMIHEDLKAVAIINQTLVPPSKSDVISIVLDVDLARNEDVPQNDDEIWVYLEELRVRKNEIFEACLSDAAKELFS